MLPVCGTTVVSHARIVRRIGAHAALGRTFPPRPAFASDCACDLEIRVTFVVTEQDVVPGPQRLDEGVFKDQRLGLGSHHRSFQARNLADHEADTRAPVVFLEVARHPALEVDGLAHIKHLTGGIEKPVNAGQRRQSGRLHRQSGQQTTRAIGGGGITRRAHAAIVGCSAAQTVCKASIARDPAGMWKQGLLLFTPRQRLSAGPGAPTRHHDRAYAKKQLFYPQPGSFTPVYSCRANGKMPPCLPMGFCWFAPLRKSPRSLNGQTMRP